MRNRVLLILAVILTSFPLQARKFSLSTNALGYLNLATFNLEASMALDRHWSVHAGAKVNPFSFSFRGQEVRNRCQTYHAGVRWWPWHSFSGWWVAPKLQYEEYNRGGIFSRRTEEGDAFGLGISAGYAYMVHPHVNIEFGVGIWSGMKYYSVYSCPTCGLTEESGNKVFLLPNDIILSVAYVF